MIGRNHPRAPARLVCGALAALLSASPAAANAERCGGLTDLVAGARTGALFDAAREPEAKAAMSAAMSGAPTACGAAAEGGGRAYFCYWSHPFRDPAARAGFEALAADIERCLPRAAAPETDATVNHPDSYDAATYAAEGAAVSISLKDKGGLERTLIFLRVVED